MQDWNVDCFGEISRNGYDFLRPDLTWCAFPDEKVDIETVGKWWKHLVDILERLTKEA